MLFPPTDPDPVSVQNEGAAGAFLLVCDHAGQRIPSRLGDLGLKVADLGRHIAWDLGAAALTRMMAERLGCTAVLQPYSRLVIDCNREPGRADAIPEISDQTPIPGNAGLSPEARKARIAEIHQPYHARIGALLDEAAARGETPVLVLVHSFTPALTGQPTRPWHVGVLHRGEPLAARMLTLLRQEPDLLVGDNQPYAMDAIDYTAPHHADPRGLAFLELEIRQDLLAEEPGCATMAERLCRLLVAATTGSGPG